MEKDFVTKEQFEQVKTGSTAAESSLTASKATIEATRSSAEASRSNAEALKAQVEAARASVESAKASGEATKAAIENAKIQLGFTTLTAPFSGLAGSISARVGDLVKANDASLVTLNQMDPILVRFAIPEADLPGVMRYRKDGTLKVRVELPGRSGETRLGKIVFVDNAVDRATGTIALKAEFENNDGALWPGQFTNLSLTLYTLGGAVLAPSPAIQTGQKGPYLYVVGADMSATLRPVRPGPSEGGMTVVEEGLAADETVVVDGQLKLTPGATVAVKPPSGASSEAPRGAAQ
jgi:multidrug efflux system membrane fusion protein